MKNGHQLKYFMLEAIMLMTQHLGLILLALLNTKGNAHIADYGLKPSNWMGPVGPCMLMIVG